MYAIDQLSPKFAKFLESSRPSARLRGEWEDAVLTKIDLADILDVREGRFALVLRTGLGRDGGETMDRLAGNGSRAGRAGFEAIGVFDRKGRCLYQLNSFFDSALFARGVERSYGDEAVHAGIAEVRQWVLDEIMADLASRPAKEGSVLDGVDAQVLEWERGRWKDALFQLFVEKGNLRNAKDEDVRRTVEAAVGKDAFFRVLDKGPECVKEIAAEIMDGDRYGSIAEEYVDWLAAAREFGAEVEADAAWAREMYRALDGLDAKTVKLNFVNADGEKFATGIDVAYLKVSISGRVSFSEYQIQTPVGRVPEWMLTEDWWSPLDMSKAAEPFVTFRGKQVGPNAPEDEGVWFLGRK